MKNNTTILVTGGTGSLGQNLIEKIIQKNYRVRVMSRNENNLVMLKEKYRDIDIFIGDISNKCSVEQAMVGINGVFHLAAVKHVDLAEKFVQETVETNIVGSLNIYNLSLHSDIEFVISTSTDKASQGTGVYSASKMIMEKLSEQYGKINKKCKYKTIRFCNLLYSTGSVLHKWKSSILEGKPIYITNFNCTRFIQTIDSASDCLINLIDNDIENLCCKSVSLKVLLQAMIEKYSKNQKIQVIEIGLREGENLHEKIKTNGPYSNEVELLSLEEIKSMV
jgi:UDP-N-acetylglucosamine 4,6-dehydratase